MERPSRDSSKALRLGVAVFVALSLASTPLMLVPQTRAIGASGHGEGGSLESLVSSSDFRGSASVLRYLGGASLSVDELAAIDLDAVRALDASLANELAALLGSAPAVGAEEPTAPAEPIEPVPGDAVEPTQPSEGVDAEGDGAEGELPEEGSEPSEAPGEEGAGDEAGGPEADGTEAEAPAKPAAPAGSEDDAVDEPPMPAHPAPVVGPDSAAPELKVPAVEDASPYPAWSYAGDTSYSSFSYAADMTVEKFVAVIGEQARQIGQDYDLYASVMIAQAILESGSGTSKLAQAPNNNLFGIKGAYEGQSVVMRTSEADAEGRFYDIDAAFRRYGTIKESLEDYAVLLTDTMGAFYAPARKSNAATWVQAASFLEGTYATDPSYCEKLMKLVEVYGLEAYDEPLDFEVVEPLVKREYDEESGTFQLVELTLADLVAEATSHLGTPYVWGGAEPQSGFDCSGLVQYAYRNALGIELPRTTFYQCLEGEDVDFASLHAGDLLFFVKDGQASHVGIYLGNGCYLHAPQAGEEVKVSTLEEFTPTFAKRIVATQPIDEGEDLQVPPVFEEPQVPDEVRAVAKFLGR